MKDTTLIKKGRLASVPLWTGMALFFLLIRPTPAASHHNLLVLHAYHQGFTWTDNVSRGIFSVFNPKDHMVDIHVEYLDTKHHPAPRYQDELARLLRYKNIRENKDILLVSDNNALAFIQKRHRTLFRDLPVVFCGINGFQPEMIRGMKHVTGIVEFVDHAGTMDLMLSLHPDTEKILVILDHSTSGKALKREIMAQTREITQRTTLAFLDTFSFEDLPDIVASLDPKTLIYFTSLHLDKNETYVCARKGLSLVTDNARVPVYSSWDHFLGHGIVGGVLTSGYDQGREAALIAKTILEGTPAESIPVIMESPTRIKFDHNFLKKYHISLSSLPEGAIVINKPRILEDEQRQILATMVVVLLIFALILYRKNRQEKQKARELQAMNEELDRKVAEKTRTIEDSNSKLRKILNTMPSPVFIKDINGVYTGCNRAFARTILGLPLEEVENKTILDLKDKIPPDLAAVYIGKDKELLDNPGIQRYEAQVLCADGERRDFFFSKATIRTTEDQIYGIVGIMVDISERKAAEKEREALIRELHQTNERLEKISITDTLTGLYNRGHITQRITEEIQKVRRYDSLFSLVMLDLDYFKSINDTLGHHMGDMALKSVARMIRESIRNTDRAGRFGGEEFMVLLPNTDLENGYHLAERIRTSIESLTWSKDAPGLTISGGVVEYQGENMTELFKKVDELLYKAKAQGRNRIEK